MFWGHFGANLEKQAYSKKSTGLEWSTIESEFPLLLIS
jgi:hypothetical protein